MANTPKTINETEIINESPFQKGFLAVFVSTFTSVFLAELGDKTQIAILMLSAQFGKPLIVFLGSALALIFSSVIGVLLGRWLANTLPREQINFAAGIIMITLSIWLMFQAIRGFL
tara:strand:- start:109 stop:456 length:348 start_codon:yes stop_codon:yes gene_type:complete